VLPPLPSPECERAGAQRWCEISNSALQSYTALVSAFRRLSLQSGTLGCSGVRMLQEEAQHLSCGIGTPRIGIGPGGAASEPSVASAVNHPLFNDRLPIRLHMQRAIIGVATGNLALLGMSFGD
jgi:hypothetical protein